MILGYVQHIDRNDFGARAAHKKEWMQIRFVQKRIFLVHLAFRKNDFGSQSSRVFLAELVGYYLFMFIINTLFALVWGCGVMEGLWCEGVASTPCLCYVIRSEMYWSIVNMIFHTWTRPWGQNRGHRCGIYIKWNCILLVSPSIVIFFNLFSFVWTIQTTIICHYEKKARK